MSCSDDSNYTRNENSNKVRNDSIILESLNGYRDSLITLQFENDKRIAELKTNFSFTKRDSQSKSYYHNIWRHPRYIIEGKMLRAGVDSLGVFFLLSNFTSSSINLQHDSIKISIDTNEYNLKSDTMLGYLVDLNNHKEDYLGIQIWMLVQAIPYQEVKIYSTPEAMNIGRLISENMDKQIKMTFFGIRSYTINVSKKEKINIRDCYLLSENIHKSKKIKLEIEKINQQLTKNKRH